MDKFLVNKESFSFGVLFNEFGFGVGEVPAVDVNGDEHKLKLRSPDVSVFFIFVLMQFLDHLQFTTPEFLHNCLVKKDDFLFIGNIIKVDVKSSLKDPIKYLTELERVVFFAVYDVTQWFLIFFFSQWLELSVSGVGEEVFDSSHGDFVDFDEVFFEFLFVDFRGLGVDGLEVLLKNFKPISLSHIDLDHLFSQFKTAHLILIGMA